MNLDPLTRTEYDDLHFENISKNDRTNNNAGGVGKKPVQIKVKSSNISN